MPTISSSEKINGIKMYFTTFYAFLDWGKEVPKPSTFFFSYAIIELTLTEDTSSLAIMVQSRRIGTVAVYRQNEMMCPDQTLDKLLQVNKMYY